MKKILGYIAVFICIAMILFLALVISSKIPHSAVEPNIKGSVEFYKKKAGIYKEFDVLAARNILAEFSDYVKTAQWAVTELAFCVDEGIIESDEMEIFPSEAVKRGEIAQSVYNLLERANMI